MNYGLFCVDLKGPEQYIYHAEETVIASRTILLVEDEALIAMSEAAMFRRQGYEVVVAMSGEEAIEKVEAAPGGIALILMDIDLGVNRMDGTQAAQEILKKFGYH